VVLGLCDAQAGRGLYPPGRASEGGTAGLALEGFAESGQMSSAGVGEAPAEQRERGYSIRHKPVLLRKDKITI